MRDACIRAVNNAMRQAIGRDLNNQEVRSIEARVARHMRGLGARQGAAWSAKSEAERLSEAGASAARELIADMARKKQNLERRVVRQDAIEGFLSEQINQKRDKFRIAAMSRVLAARADMGGVPDGGSVDQIAMGIYNDSVARMRDLLQAGKRRGVWTIIPFNEPGTNRLIRRALAGETKGIPPEFVAMAREAHQTIDTLRQRFNAAGGEIGKLEDWGEPHRWSEHRLQRAIKRRGREAVLNDFVAAADRAKYLREDGSRMSEDEIRAFMSNALETILTDGANKTLQGERPDYAVSVAANRHRAHREIHLKADAAGPMLDAYSELGAMESMLLHLRTLARDIALIEVFGPNADLTARKLIKEAAAQDRVAFQGDEAAIAEIERREAAVNYLYDFLSGGNPGKRSFLGTGMNAVRGWVAFKSLGFTVISSLTDPVIMQHAAASRGMNAAKLWINDVAAFAGQDRRWAKRAGLLLDSVAGSADRLNMDYLASNDIAAAAASFTTRTTGLNWVTEARRQAYMTTMADTIGQLTRDYETIPAEVRASDHPLLRLLRDVDDTTWAIWRMAELESRGVNATILSPVGIHAIPDAQLLAAFPDHPMMGHNRGPEVVPTGANRDPALLRQRASSLLLGILRDEVNTAVITAGSRERALLGAGTQAGTFAGELVRSFTMFKAFPWTFFTRHLELSKAIGGPANVVAYRMSMIISLTMMGVLINWIYDLMNGKDPRAIDMSAEGQRNWIAALLRGGALGFYGDILLNPNPDPSSQNNSLTEALAGPVVAPLEDAYDLTLGNLQQASVGEETNAGPEAVRFLQRQGAPNWWYSRGLLDRYIFQAWQEDVQPGYNARRARREFRAHGTTYWWRPGEAAPDRAPDLSRALEGDQPEPRN